MVWRPKQGMNVVKNVKNILSSVIKFIENVEMGRKNQDKYQKKNYTNILIIIHWR